jgi:putative transcriptional regulator
MTTIIESEFYSRLNSNLIGGDVLARNIAIKVARAQLDMTQKELAEKVGVSRQTMNAIEQGEYNPTIKLCRAICKALGKKLDDLFWEDDVDE